MSETRCPYCCEVIEGTEDKCPHCGEMLIEQKNTQEIALKAKKIVQLLPKAKGLYTKITHIIKPIWIKVNLIFARLLAVLMIGGLIWGWNYINSLNPEWINYPTLCGIFCICICLTAVVIVLNIITTIVAYQYTDNQTANTKETNQEK